MANVSDKVLESVLSQAMKKVDMEGLVNKVSPIIEKEILATISSKDFQHTIHDVLYDSGILYDVVNVWAKNFLGTVKEKATAKKRVSKNG